MRAPSAPAELTLPDPAPAAPSPGGPSSDARRARLAVALLFLLFGTTMGSWLARVPDVKERVGLDEAGWGMVAISTTAGTFVAICTVAMVITRIGPRRLCLLAAPGLLLAAPLATSATSVAHLAAALALLGLCAGMLQAPINALAYLVERAYGRAVMSSLHACFSVGALTGGLLAILAVRLGVTPAQQLLLTGSVFAVALAVTARWQPVDEATGTGTAKRRFTPALLLLCVVAFCGSLAEGTASQWSAIYVASGLGAGSAAGALAYACFTGAMTVGRVGGDRVVQRLGRRRFLRVSTAVAATGLALGLVSGSPVGAYVGFVVLGLGLACVVPTIMSTAGDQPGLAPGQGIATVAIASWPAFLIGPPLVGWLSSLVTLRGALALVVVAALTVSVLSRLVRVAPAAAPAPAPA